jgi:AcrR family transcriptional regulator
MRSNDHLETEPVDPRIRRTRALIHEAFLKLLATKPFEEISVQDLTELATLNRATFYAHFPDKYKLLECVATVQFRALLDSRGVEFDGTRVSAVRALVLGVCDYLSVESNRVGTVDALNPHLQAAIVSVVRKKLRDGLECMEGWDSATSRDMAATSTAWALYGAVREWFIRTERPPAEQVVDRIYNFLLPLLNPMNSMGLSQSSDALLDVVAVKTAKRR